MLVSDQALRYIHLGPKRNWARREGLAQRSNCNRATKLRRKRLSPTRSVPSAPKCTFIEGFMYTGYLKIWLGVLAKS